jgi:hypothetical protein
MCILKKKKKKKKILKKKKKKKKVDKYRSKWYKINRIKYFYVFVRGKKLIRSQETIILF